ncbi:endonuclease/exonuclease/phosphatase family protein-like protein [Ophiobolus disseminans]|uniref:Endonuclease/exonuclease/phosphatase family protein-like protein n=1 Tax=Ophiobolus disseminans TaxID=1469910 RepID=A0A6A7A9T1_9PLEO|nr:endonuclease/exonuclease/phosphatase family protein-like protein [Ophiobolus disseminans]
MRYSQYLLPLLSCTTSVAAQTSGTFNALTFNVAGLPPIFNSNEVPGDKTTNTARMGQLFAQYNFSLIHVQEDFNYHATLYANDKHPYRTPTSGGVPFGSGLNSLSNYEFAAFERIKWNTCSTFDSADCLTPKGFTFMRVKIAEGVSIDAYNLHADAGTTAADLSARASNLRQVSSHIKSHSAGNVVLVFGDSNTRYTRAGDIPSVFATENSMTDAWIKLAKNGVAPLPGTDALVCDKPSPNTTCETVDKVWYRGSPVVNLQATSFDYVSDMFLQQDGSVLSDHNPVLVDFAWTLSGKWRISEAFGGQYGDWYNDLEELAKLDVVGVKEVRLRGAKRVDGVAVTLASAQTFAHGGMGGTESALVLQEGEKLVGATVCRGQKDGKARIFFVELRSSAGRTVSAGVRTSDCVGKTVEEGWAIAGFVGRDGDEIDMLGFVYAKV